MLRRMISSALRCQLRRDPIRIPRQVGTRTPGYQAHAIPQKQRSRRFFEHRECEERHNAAGDSCGVVAPYPNSHASGRKWTPRTRAIHDQARSPRSKWKQRKPAMAIRIVSTSSTHLNRRPVRRVSASPCRRSENVNPLALRRNRMPARTRTTNNVRFSIASAGNMEARPTRLAAGWKPTPRPRLTHTKPLNASTRTPFDTPQIHCR